MTRCFAGPAAGCTARAGSTTGRLPAAASWGSAPGGLLEREVVTASAAALIDRVAAGGTGALFVVGEAGLGKTSLVDQACRRAVGASLMVGVGRGHSMETGLPFGVLAQALDGVGGRGLLAVDEPRSASAADWAGRYYRVLRWLQN